MQWPSHFPEQCPPRAACPAYGAVFRVTKSRQGSPLTRKDFESYREAQPNRVWPADYSECSLCALSVMRTVEDARKLRERLAGTIPAHSRRVMRIVRGELCSDFGLFQHTPDEATGCASHHDWWVPDGLDPSAAFEFCDEGDGSGQ